MSTTVDIPQAVIDFADSFSSRYHMLSSGEYEADTDCNFHVEYMDEFDNSKLTRPVSPSHANDNDFAMRIAVDSRIMQIRTSFFKNEANGIESDFVYAAIIWGYLSIFYQELSIFERDREVILHCLSYNKDTDAIMQGWAAIFAHRSAGTITKRRYENMRDILKSDI